MFNRRIFVVGAAASLVACAHNHLARDRGRITAVDVVVEVPYEAVIYIAGVPTLVDPLSGPAQQNYQITAGVAALNLQERVKALTPRGRFGALVGEAARGSVATIGLATAGADAPADAVLALEVSRFGLRAANTADEARYSVEIKATLTLVGGGRPSWRRTLEIADAFATLGEGAPATVAGIGSIADPALQQLLEAMARRAGEGAVGALGADLRA